MAPPLLLIAVLPENVLFSTEVSSVPLPGKEAEGAALVAGRIGEQPGIYKTDGSGAAVAVIYGAAAVAGLIFRKTAAIREKKGFGLASQEDSAAAAGGAVGKEAAVGGSEGTGGQAGVQSDGPAGGRGLISLQQTALKMDFGGVCRERF